MISFLRKSFKFIYQLEAKIAFYPTIISIAGIVFAFFMFYLESHGISKMLSKHAPILVVNDTDTARSLLTTFVAGLISIMVFSFSMVMILLNRASSNFSPRVLPGLISNRRHQIILGIYNASLLYCIFTLVGIEPVRQEYQLPGFSVLISIFFMTVCLGAFIYFIHSISQEIQVNNIMSRIFTTAKNRLVDLIDSQSESVIEFPDSENWNTLRSKKSGYLQNISINAMAQIAKEHNLQFEIIPAKGTYVLSEMPILKYNNDISDTQKDDILSNFLYSKGERVADNYVLAFKQLTEIAVKAMSPGINDPGTALNAIDYITELFLIRLKKKDCAYCLDDDEKPLILINTINFEDLLYNVMVAFRTYGKGDVIIVQKLLLMFKLLLSSQNSVVEYYKELLRKETNNLYEDASRSLKNTSDLEHVTQQFEAIKKNLF
ncbi:DUF2254 domain-containing protein [Winogradskyella sp. 4-2091]|uniref:DUF2254 domain-containing protein n=1 Tax=Winogradskyella sp. 4-2091 TaxID=3381659 RepID=UPI00389249C8